jgi:arginyl-tRNA synthetase
METIQNTLRRVIQKVFSQDITPELTRPDEQFGDYSTNVAMQLAGVLNRPPRQIAEELVAALETELKDYADSLTIAGPGFINVTLHDHVIMAAAAHAPEVKPQTYKGKVVVAEYSDPNPFKALHAGHLYTTIIGDAISKLIQTAGGEVHRVNFGGDVGLHVGKAMWAIIGDDEEKAWQTVQSKKDASLHERATWMADQYVKGNAAYEDEVAKAQIVAVNKKVYDVHSHDDRDSTFAKIYWECRQWSYDYFNWFYTELGVDPFEKYYPESSTAQLGTDTVREQLKKGVYKESDGAIVFDGEAHGLHTRVFINSQGLPTYEAKDVGLIMAKWRDYHFDQSVIITGNDIVDYMKDVLKSIEQFEPELPKRTTHLTHGQVKLEGGVKMSSRKGNVLYANDILQAAEAAVQEGTKDTAYAAVKYAFLKQRIGGDIIYSPKESVAMEGNSGPYLQYAHARACSILQKAADAEAAFDGSLESDERSLARKISEYPEVVGKAVAEMMPHHICTYLYELAQTFNRFYEHNRVVGSDRQPTRQLLVQLYADVLKDGLDIMNIPAPVRL